VGRLDVALLMTTIQLINFNNYCVTGYDPLKPHCILFKLLSQEAMVEPEELLILLIMQLQPDCLTAVSRKTRITIDIMNSRTTIIGIPFGKVLKQPPIFMVLPMCWTSTS
jgi:hypothetical protein